MPKSRLAQYLTLSVAALLTFASLGAQCDSSGTPSAPAATVGPTAVPTLDFFRGRSYPTPTPQPVGGSSSAG
jgi:hypothetical protein